MSTISLGMLSFCHISFYCRHITSSIQLKHIVYFETSLEIGTKELELEVVHKFQFLKLLSSYMDHLLYHCILQSLLWRLLPQPYSISFIIYFFHSLVGSPSPTSHPSIDQWNKKSYEELHLLVIGKNNLCFLLWWLEIIHIVKLEFFQYFFVK